ncbi:MAG: helix-turn-helix domain containing protein [Rhodobacteraceae bacterium]|nr:helix-turn-helix domain containing protein [Paracoccaceae bacterium]
MSRSLLPEHPVSTVPSWVPEAALRYLAHTETGLPIRVLARQAGCHASTVLRQIRKLESRREDQLVDEALCRLGRQHFQRVGRKTNLSETEPETMTAPKSVPLPVETELFHKEACRILRRMTENGAVLAVAQEMEKAVVVRDNASGTTTRTAVVDREIAQAMALKDWISCKAPGRISRYVITAEGRASLASLLARAESSAQPGFAEAQAGFAAAPGARSLAPSRGRTRYSAPESPLTLLARRRDKAGQPFLSEDLVAVGERLREDFELAQIGPSVTQNWDNFLTGREAMSARSEPSAGPAGARDRVASALRDLGPGLGDVALRCCCYLEGLESAEKRMGWSARSGKIILRIALQRLKRHYEGMGQAGQMIG